MGFRVQGTRFMIQYLGFRVQGSGLRVQGSGCKGLRERGYSQKHQQHEHSNPDPNDSGHLGFMTQGSEFTVCSLGFRVQDLGFRI